MIVSIKYEKSSIYFIITFSESVLCKAHYMMTEIDRYVIYGKI